MEKPLSRDMRSVFMPSNGCSKCAKADVCKYKDRALDSYDAACCKIHAEVESIISLTFVCKHFTQAPKSAMR